MKKLNKLFCIIFLTFIFSIPLSVYAYTDKVYLGGENIGIEVNSKGVLIVGFYKVNDKYPGKDAGLLVGDIITEINDKEIKSSEDLQNLKGEKELSITYLRDNKKNNTTLILENEVDFTNIFSLDFLNEKYCLSEEFFLIINLSIFLGFLFLIWIELLSSSSLFSFILEIFV